MSKNNAFTLSEVLLVLSVIGVVAALTIPTLINKVSDDQFKTAWKKTYSSVSQAYNLMLIDNGGSFVNAASGASTLRALFQAKMNTILTCDDTSCAGASIKKMSGSADTYTFGYNLVLADGAIISAFSMDSPACTHSNWVATTGECGWLLVDVNGKKSPNQWGKDIYGIWLMKDNVLPWGANPYGTANSTYIDTTCSSSSSGYGCGSVYLNN